MADRATDRQAAERTAEALAMLSNGAGSAYVAQHWQRPTPLASGRPGGTFAWLSVI
jgi:hypothetical protein